MRRKKERQDIAVARDEGKHAVVVGLGKAKTTVLLGNIHAKQAELGQAIEHATRNFAGALNLRGIDLTGEESSDLGADLIAHELILSRLEWVRSEEAEIRLAAEKLGHEARALDLLARGFHVFHTLQ